MTELRADCIDHGKVGTGKGYAQRSVKNRLRYMHRLAYAESKGLDEAAMVGVVRHMCDNPRCVNSAHLVLGTHKDNSEDMVLKGRTNPPRGERGATKLTEELVAKIRAAAGKQVDVARRFGVTQSHVSRIKGGKRWAHSN